MPCPIVRGMKPDSRVRVYIACSLDGFIAGKGDDLSWLPGAEGSNPTDTDGSKAAPGSSPGPKDPGAVEYDDFIRGVGALLMGRRTYDVVLGFGIDWPYGERPVLVATNRPLDPAVPTVRAVKGSIVELVEQARQAAGQADVYLDGGNLIRQALDAGLVDDLVVTMAPILLGEGHPLFAGVTARHRLEFTGCHRYAHGMVQLHARPLRQPQNAAPSP